LIRATVRSWSNEEGWGVVDTPEADEAGVFVHFSAIEMDGYRSLSEGQVVEIELEGPLDFEQDGCRYRAIRVRPLG
jgi:cold shock protein